MEWEEIANKKLEIGNHANSKLNLLSSVTWNRLPPITTYQRMSVCSKCLCRNSRDHRGKNCPQETAYKCNVCGEFFSDQSKLEEHEKTAHKPTFLCTDCGSSFSFNYNLNKHIRNKPNSCFPQLVSILC